MITANNNIGKRVLAHRAEKGEKYTCPYCKGEVILKKGKIVMPHFAHKVQTNCEGSKESIEHLRGKILVHNHLIRQGIPTMIEDTEFPEMRPDVLAIINGRKVAFEIQKSFLSSDDIDRRNDNYLKRNIPVCWILDEKRTTEMIEEPYFTIREQEKYFKSLNYGVLFGIYKGEFVAFKVCDLYTEVPLTAYGGGYTKRLKKQKCVDEWMQINLATDLYPKMIEESEYESEYFYAYYPKRYYLCLDYNKAKKLAS